MAGLGNLFGMLKRKDEKESDEIEKKETKHKGDMANDKCGINEAEREIKNFDNNRKKICIDGISLLSLTKIGVIEYALKFYDLIITPSLVDEINKQKKDNELDATHILNLINTGKISKENVNKNKDLMQYGLYGVELEIVSHFLNGNCNYILADDAIIRTNREILKLNVISTPSFVLSLFDKGMMTKEHAISAYAILRTEKWFEGWVIDECIRRVKLK